MLSITASSTTRWRAVCIERCMHGSEGGRWDVLGRGIPRLPYRNRAAGSMREAHSVKSRPIVTPLNIRGYH
jgi:hypothetical protein